MSWLEAEAGGEALLLIMVADGHAGSEAAQISADNALPLVVSKTKDGSAASLQAALRCVCERLAFRRAYDAMAPDLSTVGSKLVYGVSLVRMWVHLS